VSNPPLIAVIDDEDPFLELMQTVLEEEGYRVVLGKVPDNALALIREAHPALVILDLNFRLSATQGMAILNGMRDDPALADIAVIVCSAATDQLQHYHDRFVALSAQTLRKPFDLSDLLVRVAAMLPATERAGAVSDGRRADAGGQLPPA